MILKSRVQASLALTEQQRAYLAQLRGVCLTALAGIIDERNAIHASLTVRAPCARFPPLPTLAPARHLAQQSASAHVLIALGKRKAVRGPPANIYTTASHLLQGF